MPCCLRLLAISVAPSTSLMRSSSWQMTFWLRRIFIEGGVSNNTLLAQRGYALAVHAEPFRQHVVDVLAEQWRRLHLGQLAVETHWPCGYLHLAGCRVLDRLNYAPLGQRGIVQELERVEHGSRRHTCGAYKPHGLLLGVLGGPFADDGVDLLWPLGARRLRLEARIAFQIFPPYDGQEPLPVLRVGATAEHVDVIVGPARLARIERVRDKGASHGSVGALPHYRLAGQQSARERHAHVLHHGILHGELQASALAGLLALIEGAKD